MFAAAGLHVPMPRIARCAGVGPATLYRHFPTKEALVTEAFTDQMRACQSIVDEGLADPDPWHGFRLVFEKICGPHARDQGFTAAFMSTFPHAMDFAAIRAYSLDAVAELARRAMAAGRAAIGACGIDTPTQPAWRNDRVIEGRRHGSHSTE